MANETANTPCPCTQQQILEHWLGHRRLTRKVIQAFPKDQLFTFSVGGMRPFGVLVQEFLSMALPVANQVATGSWGDTETTKPNDKEGLLRMWDEHTAKIEKIVPGIAPERFQTKMRMYEQYEVTGIEAIEYTIDNEIHHRGQGYVYLRALGFEPPMFYDRA